MGYAEDVRAFQDAVIEGLKLNATERLLWHRIRWMFDRKGDPKKLPIKSRVLMEMEDLPQATFNRARRKLEGEGLIRTESQRGQETVYELLPIIKNGLKGQSDGQSDGQQGDLLAHGRAVYSTVTPYVTPRDNIIYYNKSLSPTVAFQGNQGGGTGEGTGERPTVQQIEEYARQTGLRVDARIFFAINEASGWRDGNGRPIRDWRLWLAGYAARNPQTPAWKIPSSHNFQQRVYQQGELDYLFDRMSKYDECEEG